MVKVLDSRVPQWGAKDTKIKVPSAEIREPSAMTGSLFYEAWE